MSNRQPNCTPETTGKITTKNPLKISRRKEIIKIRAEINGKEIKVYWRLIKLKAGSLRRTKEEALSRLNKKRREKK